MRDVLLTIQYITILGIFIECWLVSRRLKTPLHKYLFLSCIAALVNTIGYLLQIGTQCQEAFTVALKISYFGRILIAFMLFLFVTELCKIRVPQFIKNTLLSIHLITYVFVLTFEKHNFYYTNKIFDTTGVFPRMIHGTGIVHTIHMAMQSLYILSGVTMLFLAYRKEKSRAAKKRILTVTATIFSESLFFIIQMIGIKELTNSYDFTMFGYFLGTIFILIAIFQYNLLGTREVARDFIVDRLSAGIIATDTNSLIQYFNTPAKKLFQNLEIGSITLPEEITKALATNKPIKRGEQIFAAEESDLTYKGESFGKIYSIMDETEHYRYMKELETQKIQKVEMESMKTCLRMGNETIFAIANAVEARDKSTGRHSYRVSEYAVTLAAELGFTAEEQDQLRRTGLLHDIGKIGVPDSILNKPSKLTNEEYETMKTHTVIGGEILKDFTLIPHVDEGAKFHHERYDGKGYPTGLKGEEIPLNARIIGIADAFDAMTANRIYRKALDLSFAKEELKRCSGTQFDPHLVNLMIKLIENGKIDPTKVVKKETLQGRKETR